MSIQDIAIKIKYLVGEENLCKIRLFLPITAYLVSTLLSGVSGFLLGTVHQKRLLTVEKQPIAILLPDPLKPYQEGYAAHTQLNTNLNNNRPDISATQKPNRSDTSDSSSDGNSRSGSFVTSKQGRVYYPADCASVNRIKPENRVYYSSSAELINRGYTPSKTCK